jgi:glycosyltransferase involved in cell wall biosynthesis
LVEGKGALIAPDDTIKFAEKVAQLLSHPEHCRELGRQGFDYATTNWTAKTQAQRLELFYQNRIANN